MTKIRNPILRGFNPDPSICRVGDDFYIATSTFEWYPGVQIYHSKNLQEWRLASRPLNEARLLDLTGVPDSCGVWAPCLSYADGLFWLCYTVVTRFDGDFKDTHNYLTWSSAVDGEWADPIYMNSSGFDPSLFHDDDGRKWHTNMVWDHRPDRTYFRGIVLQEYSHNERGLVGPRKVIFDGSKTDFTEGPHLYKRDDYYYLITAEGGTGYGHAVTFARSRDIWGPYEIDPALHVMTARDRPSADLQRTGHGSIIEDQRGNWWLAHLCSRPIGELKRSPLGRETALQAVHWSEDGWVRLSDPEAAFDAAQDFELQDVMYEFAGGDLPEDFQWLRVPDPSELFSLTEKPGALRLYGRDSLGSQFHSALVARRQQHFNYEATACVSFAPEDFQQSAGLAAYYNAHKFHYLYITQDDDAGRVLQVMSCMGDQSLNVVFPIKEAPVTLPEQGEVWLCARVEGLRLEFFWSNDGHSWNTVGDTLDASILSDEAGKGEGANFTGAFVGMACQDLTGQRAPADFSFFHYREF
jgi:xylan 1,4-beta-xylosidase